MTNSTNVTSLLHRLGGVYRDPTRVSNDATRLLRSTVGSNLRPSTAPLVQNDGSSTPPVLLFTGTIAMTYRGASYNIPVDIYLPPPYPIRPPVCFVRPVATMMIKENHQHVAPDGMVYMPYLHQWKPRSHNLVEMVVAMASLFGNDPPVFAKPPSAASSSASAVVRPPRYDHVTAQQQAEAAAIAESRRLEEERRVREKERIEAQRLQEEAHRLEVEQANAAADAARRAAQQELEQEQRAKRDEMDARRLLTNKLQTHLRGFYDKSRTIVQGDLSDQAKLTRSTKVLDHRLELLRETKTKLEDGIASVDKATEEIKTFVSTLEEEKQQDAPSSSSGPDDAAAPADVHSGQMLELSAENAALGDAMYFLDRALVKGRVPLDVHLKTIRTLAKRQFLVRAHLMKIGQVKASMEAGDGGGTGVVLGSPSFTVASF